MSEYVVNVQRLETYVDRLVTGAAKPRQGRLADRLKEDLGDLAAWVKKTTFARAYLDGGNGEFYVLKGFEDNDKLLAHEYGHKLGLDHPGAPGGRWKQTRAAVAAGFPIMSWTGFLRWRDPTGLVAAWRVAPKRRVVEP